MLSRKMKKTDALDQFLGFLYPNDESDPQVMKEDLEAQGINTYALSVSVDLILSRAAQPTWLERAREKRRAFEASLKEQSQEIKSRFADARELVEAMLNGSLGVSMQSQAQVFFRNKELKDLSDRDLQSLVEDLKLIELLEK